MMTVHNLRGEYRENMPLKILMDIFLFCCGKLIKCKIENTTEIKFFQNILVNLVFSCDQSWDSLINFLQLLHRYHASTAVDFFR